MKNMKIPCGILEWNGRLFVWIETSIPTNKSERVSSESEIVFRLDL